MEDRKAGAELGGLEQRAVARERPDPHLAPLVADVVQLGEVVDVHEPLGRGEAELHHRQQAVATGDDPRLRAVAFEQAEGVLHTRGTLVLERCRYLHNPVSLPGSTG